MRRVADLQRILDSYDCKEIRSPPARLGQDDEDDGIGGDGRAVMYQRTLHRNIPVSEFSPLAKGSINEM